MEYATLGSTTMETSSIALGAGGASRLGLGTDRTERDARQVVETAVESGITLIDTAEAYGTEAVIGDIIEDYNREKLVLSTKFNPYDDDELRPPAEVETSVEGSLERLNTDYIDIYHLHGVKPAEYDFAAEELRPRLEKLKEEGTIGAVGITEPVSVDPGHEMLSRAVEDGGWDVVMVGFNLLNHSARERVLEPAARKGIGTIGMVPVRRALSDPDVLESLVSELISAGKLDPADVDPEDPFGFLVHDEGASDIFDAAYRFCAHEPTVDTVLTGTGSRDHLQANIDSVLKGPLPEEDLSRLEDRFGHIDSTIGHHPELPN